MDITYHYPPELLSLLIDTIPLLCKSKRDVVTFFRGAGVGLELTQDLSNTLDEDPGTLNKYQIARSILIRLNEKSESALRERREILRRIVEVENFSTCWPNDMLKAKGLVAEIRDVINVKDSFTRMSIEREREIEKNKSERNAKQEALLRYKASQASIKAELFSLFVEHDSRKRGVALEGVLNRLFKLDNILIREGFTIVGDNGEGVVQQIDGVVEIDGFIYLVEMKWWAEPLGPGDVAQHLVRVFGRDGARGIFISNSGYTKAAVQDCRDALRDHVVVLCKLEEFVLLLEKEEKLVSFLKAKINAAIAEKNPLYEPLTNTL